MGKHNRFKVLLIGVFSGMFTTGVILGGGLVCYKQLKRVRAPKRYDAEKMIEAMKGKDIKFFAASNLDRIFQDGKTLLKANFTGSVSIHIAKNEYESFQVVVANGPQTLQNVSLNISDFISESSGAKMDTKNISWRVVGYVPTKKPYYPVKFVGAWPDPLLPVQKIDIASETIQPFWVTVYTPPDTEPGQYHGKIQLITEGREPLEIPVSIDVYHFTLPKESHLKTAFDFYGHVTSKRFPQGDRESEVAYKARIADINEKFTIEMLKYRMNPVLNVDPTLQEDLARVDRYRVYGLNNFSIGRKGGTFDNNWPADDEGIENLLSLYRTYGEILKMNKMLEYTYLYTWDEGDIGNPRVAKICSMIHRAYPGLKNMVCYHGFWVPEENPDWGKDIDIWCFNIDDFNEKKMRHLQEIGKDIWMYISSPSGFKSPNLALDFDPIDYRMISWLCWKYDIKGLLYWCVNWWPDVDPFQSAANTKWEQNGNGLLFYPGKDGPLASLRLEVFRDGMEDYEYIQLLIEKIREMKQRNLFEANKAQIQDAVHIMTVDQSIAESMFSFTKDSQTLNRRREAIAEKIEAFEKILADSKETNNP